MSAHPVDATAFSVFVMQEVSAASFDAALGSADDALAGAFFWGVDCFNCETAKKTMLAQPDALRSLGFKRFHANVHEYRGLGRRFSLHGGRSTGWHGMVQFAAAVDVARAKIWADPAAAGCAHRMGVGEGRWKKIETASSAGA
ncbi:MAG TPA: thioredoxin [Trinickia sp.]|jgi:hypothetical protein|nr:thioredoxin [Trinickia sp.]